MRRGVRRECNLCVVCCGECVWRRSAKSPPTAIGGGPVRAAWAMYACGMGMHDEESRSRGCASLPPPSPKGVSQGGLPRSPEEGPSCACGARACHGARAHLREDSLGRRRSRGAGVEAWKHGGEDHSPIRPPSERAWMAGGATPARGRGRVGGRELGAGGSARAGGPAPQARKGAASCVSRAAHSPRLVRGSSTRRAQRTTTRWLHQHPGLPLSRPSARAGCRLVFSQAASAGSSPVLRYAPGETPLEVCVEGGAVRRRLARTTDGDGDKV